MNDEEIEALVDKVCQCIENAWKGLSWRTGINDSIVENFLEIEIAPVKGEIVGAAHDGRKIHQIIDVDVEAVRALFDPSDPEFGIYFRGDEGGSLEIFTSTFSVTVFMCAFEDDATEYKISGKGLK